MGRLWAAGAAIVMCLSLGGWPAVAEEPSANPAANGGPPAAGAVPLANPTAAATPSAPPQVGLAWERVADRDLVSRPRNGQMYGVIAGGPGAIAWGGVSGTGPRIWTTVDGRDWSPATVETATDAVPENLPEVLDVTAGGPGFVAVGSYLREGDALTSIVWTSRDGLTWERVPDSPGFEWSAMDQVVAWRDGLLAFGCKIIPSEPLTCGPDRVWTSDDGVSWVRATPALPEGSVRVGIVEPSSDGLWGVGYGSGGGFVDPDAPRPPRLTSLDGLAWTVSPLPVLGVERLHPLPDGLYLTVAAIPPKGPGFIQPPTWVSRTPGVYASADLLTWTPLAVGRPLGDDIIAVGDTLVMVGTHGRRCWSPNGDCLAAAWRSTDAGRTWTSVPVTGTRPKKVAVASMRAAAALPDGTLVAVGSEIDRGTGWPSTAAWISMPGGG